MDSKLSADSHIESEENVEYAKLPIGYQKELWADLKNLSQYIEKFEKILLAPGVTWYTEDLTGLSLGYGEALINAIEYGNKNNPETKVLVTLIVDNEHIEVSIVDVNPERFDSSKAFSSVDNRENLMASHGRGIRMMRLYYPNGVNYEFLSPGNKVTLLKIKKNPTHTAAGSTTE